jgi:hypothetical protein
MMGTVVTSRINLADDSGDARATGESAIDDGDGQVRTCGGDLLALRTGERTIRALAQ